MFSISVLKSVSFRDLRGYEGSIRDLGLNSQNQVWGYIVLLSMS